MKQSFSVCQVNRKAKLCLMTALLNNFVYNLLASKHFFFSCQIANCSSTSGVGSAIRPDSLWSLNELKIFSFCCHLVNSSASQLLAPRDENTSVALYSFIFPLSLLKPVVHRAIVCCKRVVMTGILSRAGSPTSLSVEVRTVLCGQSVPTLIVVSSHTHCGQSQELAWSKSVSTLIVVSSQTHSPEFVWSVSIHYPDSLPSPFPPPPL